MNHQNHYHRFSFISCETDDSESLATPLDVSPCIPLATFPIITVVPIEPLLDRSHMPVIAGNRRYHDHSEVQTDRHLTQSSTVATLQSSHSNNSNNNHQTRSRNFWPRLKQMVRLNNNNNKKPKKEQHDQEQKDDLSNQLSALQISPKPTTNNNNMEDNKRRRWFDKKQMKKTRIQPS
ncbi:hypothetical protein INT45_007157 [Circinella minor]|uniref:Uncharacterized protein n=1 Tax=Circinella minor TaxID=1195481 RepID=A0A8H7VG51_9FUNG|nr:hypothetical protein INT45_007157 [Circinella minor]